MEDGQIKDFGNLKQFFDYHNGSPIQLKTDRGIIRSGELIGYSFSMAVDRESSEMLVRSSKIEAIDRLGLPRVIHATSSDGLIFARFGINSWITVISGDHHEVAFITRSGIFQTLLIQETGCNIYPY